MTENETKTYPSPLTLVREFHSTYGQAIRTVPQIDVPERKLRIELIVEEAEELQEANEQNDFIEIADALADILYVTYGAALTHGFNPDAVFGITSSPVYVIRERFIAKGGQLASVPALDVPSRHEVVKAVVTAAEAYKKASDAGNVEALNEAVISLIVSSYEASAAFGIDIDDVLEEVQRSNMSKLGSDGKPMYREDGKVIKGPNFFVPDLVVILGKQGWVSSN